MHQTRNFRLNLLLQLKNVYNIKFVYRILVSIATGPASRSRLFLFVLLSPYIISLVGSRSSCISSLWQIPAKYLFWPSTLFHAHMFVPPNLLRSNCSMSVDLKERSYYRTLLMQCFGKRKGVLYSMVSFDTTGYISIKCLYKHMPNTVLCRRRPKRFQSRNT